MRSNKLSYLWPLTPQEVRERQDAEYRAKIDQASALKSIARSLAGGDSELIAAALERIANWCERQSEPPRSPHTEALPIDGRPVDPSFLETSIEEVEFSLRLSARLYNCLKHAGIETVGDLIEKTEAEMLRIKNFGKGCLREINGILSAKQLSFGIRFDAESNRFIAVPGYRPDQKTLATLAALNDGRS